MILHRSLVVVALALAALAPVRAAETDSEVDARKTALELAGAFSNDGFKIRDGHWSGALNRGERAVIAVNLYAGNQYWFSVGAQSAKSFGVHLYDESGQPLTTENYDDEEKTAAGFAPMVSGQYFVTIGPVSDENAGTFCLVYSYR
jgi:hypothetical protein